MSAEPICKKCKIENDGSFKEICQSCWEDMVDSAYEEDRERRVGI